VQHLQECFERHQVPLQYSGQHVLGWFRKVALHIGSNNINTRISDPYQTLD